jgi:hypothetical protein
MYILERNTGYVSSTKVGNGIIFRCITRAANPAAVDVEIVDIKDIETIKCSSVNTNLTLKEAVSYVHHSR